jgi:ketosteroid isomerase-like protein
MQELSVEDAIQSVLTRIAEAWRERKFEGLEGCFDERAVIVGPDYREYAVGARPARRVIESSHAMPQYSITQTGRKLRAWPDTAIYTFAWQMTYERENGPKRESGTDQLVLGRFAAQWRVLFRYIYFALSV